MGNETSSLSGKVGLDLSDYKTGIAEMNRDIKIIETGFKASAAALGDWSNSATGLESRIKALSSEIETQQKIVDANVQMYDKMVQAYGADSKAAEDQAIKVNASTEKLNKMQYELGNDQTALNGLKTDSDKAGMGVQELGTKSDNTSKKMLTLKDVANGLKGVLGGVVTVAKDTAVAIMAVAGAAVAVGTAVGGMVLNDAESADSLRQLSEQTGLTYKQLQEMTYIAANTGLQLSDLTDPMSKLVRSMGSAETGTKASVEAFKELGVNIYDSNGNLRDASSVYGDALSALSKMSDHDPGRRDRPYSFLASRPWI